MPSTIGSTLKVTVFGQSHSPAVGCVVEGLPAGFAVDQEALARFVARRAPGQDNLGTPRKEADLPRIVSGLNPLGQTCGAPLCALIENTNTRSGDYSNILSVPRPGHADYTAWAKWHGAADVPGGGHFSGRLTGPLCIAGGIALQWLAAQGVRVAAHIDELAGVSDAHLAALGPREEEDPVLAAQMDELARKAQGRAFPVLDDGAGQAMQEAVLAARAKGDTVGGIVECAVTGLPAGVGSPMFDGIENVMARALFGIPSVKGVEFGRGFASAGLTGTQDNDPYDVVGGRVRPRTNNAGGILGGITSGAPVHVRCAFKPISSVMVDQDSVDLTTMEPATLKVRGRHDTTAVIRAVPVVEAVAALAVADALLSFPPEAAA